MRLASALIAAIVIIGLMAITIVGCSGGSPSATADKYYKAIQENDCEKLRDLVHPQLADKEVEECKQHPDKLVSYRILGENIDWNIGLAVTAGVETELTFREDGKEKTNTVRRILEKTLIGDWYITSIP